ncbi:MAG: hypothetical protein ACOYEO_07790 [bacterium]|jgi:cell division protein FtsX
MKAIHKWRDGYAALLIIGMILTAGFTVRLRTNNREVILPRNKWGAFQTIIYYNK